MAGVVCLVACDRAPRDPAGPRGETADSALSAPSTPAPRDGVGGNVLFVLSDDQGIDKVGVYGAHPEPPRTPVIDALAAEGVLFRRAYAHPVCSPTRASLLTGRYGNRYGLGEVIQPSSDAFSLRADEVLLPEALASRGYASAAFGKWHLAGFGSDLGTAHPNEQGFGHYAGSFGNLTSEKLGTETGIGTTHYYWQKTTDGALAHVHAFAATENVDDAIESVTTLPEPWFVYVAFNTPHSPLTLAPEELTSLDLDILSTPPEKHAGLVEAMDTELGRLLASLSDEVRARTTIVFMSDNGTEGPAITQPWRASHGKNTPYEGGIRVPLIIAGPTVVDGGRQVDAIVHAVDLYPTLLELAGVPTAEVVDEAGAPVALDGVSFASLLRDPSAPAPRAFVYTGKFGPNGAPNAAGGYGWDWDIVLDQRWKYVRGYGEDMLFDLEDPDPDDGMEGQDLLRAPLTAEAQDALERLKAELERVEATAAYEPGPG